MLASQGVKLPAPAGGAGQARSGRGVDGPHMTHSTAWKRLWLPLCCSLGLLGGCSLLVRSGTPLYGNAVTSDTGHAAVRDLLGGLVAAAGDSTLLEYGPRETATPALDRATGPRHRRHA